MQLGLTFGYMVTDNIGVGVVGRNAIPPQGYAGAGTDLATVHQLPPTLMAQYYSATSRTNCGLTGVGVNYTTFFDEKFNDYGKSAGLSKPRPERLWVAAQAGWITTRMNTGC